MSLEDRAAADDVDVGVDDVDVEMAVSAASLREQFYESNDDGNAVDVNDPSGDADDAAAAAEAAQSSLLEIDQQDVSDISASSSEIDGADDEYNIPVDFNDGHVVMDKFDSLRHHSSSRVPMTHINNHDTTTDNEIRNQRENVDRLLMMSGAGILGGPASSQHYDQEYYRNAGDWLRIMQRRHAAHMAERYPEMRASYPSDYNYNSEEGYVHGSSPGYGNTTGNQINPDHYYRGFDNSRIRMGVDHIIQHQYYPEQHSRGLSPTNMIYPCDDHDSRCISHPLDVDEELQCEGADVPIICGESMVANSTFLEGECREVDRGHKNDNDDINIICSSAKFVTRTIPRNESHDVSQHSRQSKTTVEGRQSKYKSTLRLGGIIPRNPDPLESSSSMHRGRTNPLVPSQQLQQQQQQQQQNMQDDSMDMHLASCDSKYETYACCVDRSQDDRSIEIPVFTLTRPHMRSFHCAWASFFLAFLAWFAISPLLVEVQKSLELTKEQLWTSSICSVAGAVITRCVAGLFCDIYGARWMTATVLFICGIPTMCTGFVNSAVGLNVLRLFTGIGGSSFVTCQYWTCSTFTKEVAGTANALAAGWGNLGGGVAQIFVGSMLFPFFKWIYAETDDPAELSWRTCCAIPGLFCVAFTFVIIRYSDDSPKGNYHKRKNVGLMQRPSAMKNFKAAMLDYNTWLLLIQYGCCFGVELTTTNAAALYFKEEFEMSTEAAAAVASIFGWMNLFARALGGFLSDISNAYRGMRGRLISQLFCFLCEGNSYVDASYIVSRYIDLDP